MVKEKKYKITLETVEPLRIGAPKDPRSGIENPITVLGDRIVVPGATLKGALRAQIERFLIDSHYDIAKRRWAADKQDYQPCIPSTSPSGDEQRTLVNIGKYRDGGTCHYPCKHGKEQKHTICPACYFLGAAGLPGFVRVPFLNGTVKPEELYSSRIDRATGTVVEGSNRPYQLVRQGVQFEGEMTVVLEDSVTGWKLGEPRDLGDASLGDRWLESEKSSADELIKKYILERLKAIEILGGYKSKGFGRVKITVEEVKG